ncbi:endonuclease III-like protein 1 [Drosophila kikkawai]|uniref:Endonuclease III homolog n=1 Tax=Drosophila kikkawai TaxID=30033 RepID=A0A6P4I351_DROKI|nr:endonuclease III-like protein 1 [Drosophila kikkawai]
MAKNVKKLSLANKLAKKGDVIKPTEIIGRHNRADNVRDIEDLVGTSGSSNSIYFSPLQTRKQRGTLKNINIKSEPLTPTRVVPKKIKNEVQDELQSKILMGSVMVVKCKVVPDALNSSIRIDRIKKELETEFKQEPKQEILQNIKKEIKPQKEPLLFLGVEAPHPLWQSHLENIRTMRNRQPAPVDTMGCHRCADPTADPKTQRFQNLVALMLSSQTKDQTTFEAMNRLKERTLTTITIKEMPVTELENLLHPVSFYKNKAKYLKQTVEILIDKYDSDIPDNPKDLIALPGVGPKMAHICMAVAWNKVTGIGVDVHVHRLSNRLGWVLQPTKEPEQTRIGLEKWLPHSLWSEVNHLFVGFGQTICTPLKPNCGECLNKDICPSAFKETKAKKSKE